MTTTEKLTCLEEGPDCKGPVEYHCASDRDDFKAFPRCQHHIAKREASAARTRELLSPVPAPWFDPMDAGEVWGEDDY